jgi:membrane protein implicated in regulation of membrane protease activity
METLGLSHGSAWLMIGALLIFLEIAFIQGIGLLFAGLGAICVGAILSAGMAEELTSQFIMFFIFTAIWTGLLWKPLKNFIKGKNSGYSDMVGATAIVYEEDLTRGKIGKVKWSGTIMKCKLEDDFSLQEKIALDTEVIIIKVSHGILIVRPASSGGVASADK